MLYNNFNIFILTFAGHDCKPQTTPGKLMFLTASIMSLIILTCYCGSLTSVLSVQKMVLPFHTLEGLLNNGKFSLYVMTGASASYIKVSTKYVS